MSKKTLRSAVNKVDLKKKDKETLIPGLLGLNSAAKQVSVPNRAGYVWVRLRNNDSEVVPVFNDQVSPVFDLPVLVVRDEIDPTRYRIYGKDSASYENWQSWSPYLPAHGGVHSRSPDSGGGDVTWVYGGQFMPLLVSPSGTSGAGNVIIDPFIYYHNDHNQYKYAGGTGTGDILVHKPTDNTAKMVLIYLDTDGNPQLLPGSTFDATVTGTSSVLQYIPTVDVDSGMPLAAARIVSGTSSVVWSNLYDLRPIITGNDKDKIAIFDDGSFQVSGTAVSFDTNLSVAVTGTVAFVSSTAAGGSSSPTYPAISDDLIFVATGTQIDFGENLSVANTGTVVFISSTDTDTPTYPAISEDGVFVATGTNIDFGANMNVVATGTSVFISAVAGGGGGGGADTYPIIYDDNVFVATGTAISFDGNIDTVIASGTSVFVSSAQFVNSSSDAKIGDDGIELLNDTSAFPWGDDDSRMVRFVGTLGDKSPTGKIYSVNSASVPKKEGLYVNVTKTASDVITGLSNFIDFSIVGASGSSSTSSFTISMDYEGDTVATLLNSDLKIEGGNLNLQEQATPETPASNTGDLYPKSDGKIYFINDAGTEYDLTQSGGGGGSDLSVYATGTLLMTGTTGLAFGDGLQVTSTGTIAYIDSPSALLGLSHYSGTSTEYTSNSWRTVTGTMTTFRNTFLDDVIVFVNMEANLDGGGSEEIPETHYFRISFDGDGGSGSSPVHYVEEVQSGNPDRILGMSFIRENVPIGGHTIELQTKSTTTTVRTFNTVNIGIVSSRIKPSYLLDDDYNYLLDSEGNVLLDG